MSHTAIAAALALPAEVSAGERLAAFSLASFADRDGRARPGTPAAAARAGVARSAYLEARGRLVQRGLVMVAAEATGRGRASTLALPFVSDGPWWEGEINAELFEAVLGYSSSRGSARLLIAALAALADSDGVVTRVTTEGLCAAAGISDRTYRRVCGPLLAAGEVVVDASPGGRGRVNRWEVRDPRAAGSGVAAAAAGTRRRAVPPAGARPLLATVVGSGGEPVLSAKPCQDRTVSARKHPAMSGVSSANPGQDRTVLPETPARTPAETPAPNARAGREPQNPRTSPPCPPVGGTGHDSLVVEESFVTGRGRRRTRRVAVDLAAIRASLALPEPTDRIAWERTRMLLAATVGESTFEIWLAPLELIAVDSAGAVLIAAPDATANWIRGRFGHLLSQCGEQAGCAVRLANPAERAAASRLAATPDFDIHEQPREASG
jgi:hypothetical protein